MGYIQLYVLYSYTCSYTCDLKTTTIIWFCCENITLSAINPGTIIERMKAKVATENNSLDTGATLCWMKTKGIRFHLGRTVGILFQWS